MTMTRDQFLNIVAFLILIGEADIYLGKSPDYIMEKWDRYIRTLPPEGPGWSWGLDSGNRAVLDAYAQRWKVQLNELFPTKEGVSDDRQP